MQCILVTPESTLRDAPADFVAVNMLDGELGIAPHHTPLIGRLGNGELRIRQGEATERFYVEGGFVEVLDDVVTVLTQKAVPSREIFEDVAEELLNASLTKPAHTPELMAIRDRAIDQSRAQMRVARRAQ